MSAASLAPTATPAAAPRRLALIAYWGVVALLWMGWITLAYLAGRYGDWGRIDFSAYHTAARLLAVGVSPYAGPIGVTFIYPPLLGQLLIPLARLDPLSAWQVWFVLNILALIGAITLFSRYTSPRMARFLWLTPLFFQPILDALIIGQVTIFILVLLVGAWIARHEEQPFLAGALIALAAWLKIYPALLAVFFLWKRDWQVARGIAVVGGLLLLLQIAVSGVTVFSDSFQIAFSLSSAGQPTEVWRNSSLFGFAARLFVPSPRVVGIADSPILYTVTRALLTVGCVMGLLALTRRRPAAPTADQRGASRFDLEYSLALLSAMLLSPTLWGASMPPLLFCFWLLWRERERVEAYLVAGCWVVLTTAVIFEMGYLSSAPLPALLLSFGFYALVVLWGIHVMFLAREKRVVHERS